MKFVSDVSQKFGHTYYSAVKKDDVGHKNALALR